MSACCSEAFVAVTEQHRALSQADLGDPSSLPAALVGIHTVIDCATARPEESTSKVDWEGKVSRRMPQRAAAHMQTPREAQGSKPL